MNHYTVVQKPEVMMVGIACRTSNAPDAGPQDIPRLWQRFFSENIASLIRFKASSETIALYCDYAGDHTKPYTVVIGCPVTSLDEIPEGMVGKVIPSMTYALFDARGEFPESLVKTWQTIWQTDLKRTYTGDYEVYGSNPNRLDVLIAIE